MNAMQCSAESAIQPIADLESVDRNDFVETADGYALRGSECCQCGRKFFPRRKICLGCAGQRMEETLLARHGKLYSFSTVHVSSSRPTPYTLGYIDLDDGLRLLATLAGDPMELAPDIPVSLISVSNGWAFALVERRSAA